MAKAHNKKRNVGIIYEQLLRCISESLVEGDELKAKVTSEILKKHFKPGSQLYREFRLFNALVKTTVKSESLATRILGEAKKAAIGFDKDQLRREKAALIKEINYRIDDQNFYHQHVGDYRSYATIQTLLNDWRRERASDLVRIAKYEDIVCEWLMTERVEEDVSYHRDEDVNSLSVKIMTEKFNKKYGQALNSDQAKLIQEYVFSLSSGDTGQFRKYLEYLRESTLSEIDYFSETCDNDVLNEKINVVRENVNDFKFTSIDDDVIAKFLLVSGLKKELLESENG
ncbi:MAG: hypothetical protein CME70_06225 [Halobacteriovorax sp.]|nr:hypothetical protein [Halobacteriovorax sp.]|tara:strand:+ start:504 stop:1358 length:855 start_codon:yes stop_codon:yes gene_type:complete